MLNEPIPPWTVASAVIVGLGKTGLSCARFLANRGLSVTVVDSREAPPGLAALQEQVPGVAVRLGDFEVALMQQAERLVISPGVALSEPAIQVAQARGIPVLGDIELFAYWAQAPVIAITGSNGKSTVTVLVEAMARQAGKKVLSGGNLGLPALELLEKPVPDLYVLELSSFQLETTSTLNAVAACILNISPDHMDRYPNLEAYVQAKGRVYHGTGAMVINADDVQVAGLAQPERHCLRFTLGAPAADEYGLRERAGETWLARGHELLLPARQFPLVGRHNLANALAALALGEAAGLPQLAMLSALREFRGLPHRCEWVAQANGVDWYNDSKGTNVGATVAAIEGLHCQGKLVLIAGGVGKGADFSPLCAPLSRRARAVVLMGQDAPRLEAALANSVPLYQVNDMGEAVNKASALAEPGDSVLLSPACASFDMYSGFEARGQAFIQAVQEHLS
ncbi:UDP-N-acetylmuramoylalanine/D-glutamate ligase [Nitrosococcus halophilus Nc 4]|uniref:UDP-N-acetylmuramoylalanine--D-glutamate ligase n=1 Tax=Nitrosococcus halophilus (strain Nc4) TaxID=472759 RepID=D5BW24_NITHN|nr:UDP-N-acetylmuramoyl-L-alanine--D-glutamate ligase [Nitrosococcus halophilus]ADE13674.1 UDP-N-acetylmuramoylalanine/D-glutamate ligase [Nitrosococcus halophilus Nc 4]